MIVVLIRHVKSDWSKTIEDFERPILSSRKADLTKVCVYLKREKIVPGYIFCSAAKRTSQSAKVLCKCFDIDYSSVNFTNKLYECSSDELSRFLKDEILSLNANCVFVVGHNPAISDFTNQYLGQNIDNVPTSAAIIITVNHMKQLKFKGLLKPKSIHDSFSKNH